MAGFVYPNEKKNQLKHGGLHMFKNIFISYLFAVRSEKCDLFMKRHYVGPTVLFT